MAGRVIARPGGVNDLKKQIIWLYVKGLKAEFQINKSLLSDPDWASSNDDFHKKCRKDLEDENKNIERQLGMLKKYTS